MNIFLQKKKKKKNDFESEHICFLCEEFTHSKLISELLLYRPLPIF